MAERIRSFTSELSKFNEAVSSAVRYLNAGKVIIVAAEFGYVYLADAFNTDAVKTIHVLRRDEAGVASQVFIKSVDVLSGIAAPLTQIQIEVLKKILARITLGNFKAPSGSKMGSW